MIPCFFFRRKSLDFVEKLEQKFMCVYPKYHEEIYTNSFKCIQKESMCAITKSYHEHHHSISKIKQKVPDLLRKMGCSIQFVKSNQLKKDKKKGENPPQPTPTSTPTNALRCPSLCHVSFLSGRQQQLHHLSSMVLTGLEVVHLQDRKYTI